MTIRSALWGVDRRWAAVAIVIGAAFMSACGQGASATAPHTARIDAAAAATREYQQQLDDVSATIGGTASQRGAGEQVLYHLEQDPFTTCMRAAGIDYTPVPFVNQWASWPVGGAGAFSTKWLAALDWGDHLVGVVEAEAAAQRSVAAGQSASDKAYLALSDSDRAAWDAAVASCPEGKNVADAWHPSGYYPLLAKFNTMVDGVDGSLGDRFGGDYQSCMKSRGFSATDHADLVAHLRASPFAANDVPAPGETGSDAWQAWVESVNAAAGADAACRVDAYNAGWAVLGPQVAAFAQDNAAALQDEEAGWQRFSVQAAASS